MDKKEARTAWIIAGILAVLLVIAVVFWMNAKKDLEDVQRDGYTDIGAMRDLIALDCGKTDEKSTKLCAEHIDDLSEILKEFSKDLEDATTTAPAPQ